ncbi:MAG: hypothetical protein AAFN70_13030, partial [Planctomycetota bacterium]
MFGVGSIVVASAVLLVTGLPLRWLPGSTSWSISDWTALAAMVGGRVIALLPLDLLGGFLLPNRWRPGTISLNRFLIGWLRGALVQGTLFVATSLLILSMGRSFGLPGALAAIAVTGVLLIAMQLWIAKLVGALPTEKTGLHDPSGLDERDVQAEHSAMVSQALSLVSHWGWKPRPILMLQNHDTGFTGGIVGLPGMESVVLSAASLNRMSKEQLAVTIARRFEAIQSGSRTRGVVFALVWAIVGFALSALLPRAGVTSVGELAMTCLGFTQWTFLGLLVLPTLSRQASYAIDGELLQRGVSPDDFEQTIKTLDELQDDEPRRSAIVETIFHPVPSVDNRRIAPSSSEPIAWHAARMTLFVTWACMGMLVRAVHCNVGRPELWVMLPTD